MFRLSKPELAEKVDEFFVEDVYSDVQFREPKNSRKSSSIGIKIETDGKAVSRSMIGSSQFYKEYMDEKEAKRKKEAKQRSIERRQSSVNTPLLSRRDSKATFAGRRRSSV